jgi:hypothetical protein
VHADGQGATALDALLVLENPYPGQELRDRLEGRSRTTPSVPPADAVRAERDRQ